MDGKALCGDYRPGPTKGKSMAVCGFYILTPPEASGACKRPDHFMCEFWLEQQKKKGNGKNA